MFVSVSVCVCVCVEEGGGSCAMLSLARMWACVCGGEWMGKRVGGWVREKGRGREKVRLLIQIGSEIKVLELVNEQTNKQTTAKKEKERKKERTEEQEGKEENKELVCFSIHHHML